MDGGWNFRATILAEAESASQPHSQILAASGKGSRGLASQLQGSNPTPATGAGLAQQGQYPAPPRKPRLPASWTGEAPTVQGGEAEVEVEVTMKGQYPPMDPFLQPPSLPSFHFFLFLPERV